MADRVSDAPTIFVAWQDFLAWLLPTTAKLPKHVRFTFVNRIDNLALDIAEDLTRASPIEMMRWARWVLLAT